VRHGAQRQARAGPPRKGPCAGSRLHLSWAALEGCPHSGSLPHQTPNLLPHRLRPPPLPQPFLTPRRASPHPPPSRVLDSNILLDFFDQVEVANFEIASDAFSSFKDLLTRHKAAVAQFLADHYLPFFEQFYALLQSSNYVTRRQSLKVGAAPGGRTRAASRRGAPHCCLGLPGTPALCRGPPAAGGPAWGAARLGGSLPLPESTSARTPPVRSCLHHPPPQSPRPRPGSCSASCCWRAPTCG
jgi:hypothetical protein